MTNFFDNTELWLNLHNLSLLSDKLNKKSMYKQNSKDQNVITAFIVVENACERFCMMWCYIMSHTLFLVVKVSGGF